VVDAINHNYSALARAFRRWRYEYINRTERTQHAFGLILLAPRLLATIASRLDYTDYHTINAGVRFLYDAHL